ncbi:glutamate dehydrogenase [Mycobacterium sp. ACS4331]|nr:glutamate dehydrogenase [Mycobacterium sp. ACS4331]
MFIENPDSTGQLEAIIWWPDGQPPLGEVCRAFEHLGLRTLRQDNIADGRDLTRGSLHRFTFDVEHDLHPQACDKLRDAFSAQAEYDFVIDEYASLICTAGISWRNVVLVRAAGRFLRQTGLNFSHAYIATVLRSRPDFVGHFVGYLHARFDPDTVDRAESINTHRELIAADIEKADTLDEDRILRSFESFVSAMLRTNWFQQNSDGTPKPYASFKFDSRKLGATSAVTPLREIFVDANTVEGIHVRSATVARGGLRFSDRTEDYRTEVLGLMKTQTVKNAPIVPSGAKGAFIRRTADTTPAQAYEIFVSGLLDLVDNRTDSGYTSAPRTIAYDGEDSYLVVAADKGTARFSDLANSLSCQRGYWLADAFASGGSTGYDHKAMGITARGAWLSVRRHFEDMGVDVAADPVTVVGIGDMSGDVFGNGMLLSRQLRLVAAFDHRHIFVDPDPDPETSFAARRTLAQAAGSSWADYDSSALSEGGGVWSRSAKQIDLAPAAQQRLGLSTASVTPDQLIKAILRADVDLLWNGGIGTYVKAGVEGHAEAADPANDAVRVNAGELRCRVIGEGGNLGLTQRARIEYAMAGGRINADFIDNAAGVATSDLEVNIKIAIDAAQQDGRLAPEVRNDVLASATADVAEHVLRQCDGQLLAISMAESQAAQLINRHERLIAILEQDSGIDRDANVLPTTEELTARVRAGRGLSRPEIAVLLAHSKNVVREELLASPVPDATTFRSELATYFPAPIRSALGDIRSHPLEREIIATRVADSLINHLGPGLIYQLEERLGVRSPAVASAYAVVRELFDIDAEWTAAQQPEPHGTDRRPRMHSVQLFVEHIAARLLRRHGDAFDIDVMIATNRPAVDSLRRRPDWTLLRDEAVDLVDTALRLETDVNHVADVYLRIDEILGLTGACTAFDPLASAADWWDAMAGCAIRDELADRRHALVAAVLEPAYDHSALSSWTATRTAHINRFIATTNLLYRDGRFGIAQAMTLIAELRLLHDHTRRLFDSPITTH